MQKDSAHPKRPRHFLVALAALLSGWIILWGTTALALRIKVEAWAEETQNKPLRIELTNPHLSGTPLLVSWAFEKVKGTTDTEAGFNAKDVVLSATPWNWGKIRLRAETTSARAIPLPLGQHTVSFESEALDGTLRKDRDGDLSLMRLELLKASVADGAESLVKGDEIEFEFAQSRAPAAKHDEADATLLIKGRGLLVDAARNLPLGNRIAAANILLRLMGPMPDFNDTASVAKWNEASGVLECDALNLVWGPLTVEMKGTLALTSDLQPEGAFSGRVDGLKEALQALLEAGAIDKKQEATMRSTLTLFGKKPAAESDAGVDVPLTLQNNGLYLGPVRFLDIPPIKWRIDAHPVLTRHE